MFNADRPIQTQQDDLLGRSAFSAQLARAILQYKTIESLSIALFGDWGSGKTSILNMVIEQIETLSKGSQFPKPLIIHFNPWFFSDQNQLINQFFSEIANAIGHKSDSERYTKIGNAIQVYSKFFVPFRFIPSLGIIDEAAKAFGEIGKAASQAGEAAKQNIHSVKKELNQLLEQLDHKLIVLIDDIDRLNCTEIRQIFQLVKSLADFPNTIYLLSFDKTVIIKALSKVQEGDGDAYLKKVIQVPFEIPQLSEMDIAKILFSELDKLIADIPEQKWDARRWGNIYHGGLKYLFSNLREVYRHINTLSFSFGLLKNDVNPVDLIAITAIQIFMPSLYENIKTNKDLFTGASRDMHGLSLDSDGARLSLVNQFIKETKGMPFSTLKEFLTNIFPMIGDMGYGSEFFGVWRKDGRICSPDIFDIFFRLSIPQNDLSISEVERILLTGHSRDTFSEELLKLIENGKIIRFLERLEDYTRKDLLEENIGPMFESLIDLGDLFPKAPSGLFLFDTPIRISRVLSQLLKRIETQDARFELYRKTIKSSRRSLYSFVDHIGIDCQRHGLYGFKEKSEPSDGWSFNDNQLKELVTISTEKIREWASSGKLAGHEYLLDILQLWRRWESLEAVREYVRVLIQTDSGLIKFIPHFITKIHSAGFSDHVGSVKHRVELKNLENFVNLDEVDYRLRKIKNSDDFYELDEKEKDAIGIFLDTRDGKISLDF